MTLRLLLPLLLGILALLPAGRLAAQSPAEVVTADLRPGWRMADGTHMAALHLRLAPGWKTYWRAPGDAGIPPLFDWTDSRGVGTVDPVWPTPIVFHQSGMRSVGYAREVVLPLRVTARTAGDLRLRGIVDIGVCQDICLPHRMHVDAVLPAAATRPDPVIAAALADRPLSAAEAGVRTVRCEIFAAPRGLGLRARIALPGSGPFDAVIETADPAIWVAEPDAAWQDGWLVAETSLHHAEGAVRGLDRSGIRITLLQGGQAIDIRGCTG